MAGGGGSKAFELLIILGILFVLAIIWNQKRTAIALQEGFEDASAGSKTPTVRKEDLKVAIAVMMRKPTDVALWFDHHRKVGIKKFYVRLEDSPGVAAFLETQKDVWFKQGESDKENNYTTQITRQTNFVNSILPAAAEEGIDWVIHIDVDELLEGDVLGTLATLDPKMLIAKIKNIEAVYSEEEPTCFSAKKFIRCDKGGPCTAYVNGKGAGRPVKGVTLGGAHDFVYNGTVDPAVTAQIEFEQFHVLHYDSCSIGTWLEKFAHMSKKAKLEDIVFPYYKQSIEVAKKAISVYKENKMREDMQPEWTYERSGGK
jgi:hypothetical protein